MLSIRTSFEASSSPNLTKPFVDISPQKLYPFAQHDEKQSIDDLFISPEHFPEQKSGDLLCIQHVEKKDKKVVLQVSQNKQKPAGNIHFLAIMFKKATQHSVFQK
jgi:hypothetical protein